MRHHDFIQKKILGYMNDFYQSSESAKEYIPDVNEWNEFIEEITNFDNFDNYIDLLVTDNAKVIVLQYFYSHVNGDGKLDTLDVTKLNNVWINDNMNYYLQIESIMNPYINKKEEVEND